MLMGRFISELSRVNESRLSELSVAIAAWADIESEQVWKSLARGVATALDYDPVDIEVSALTFFASQRSSSFQNLLTQIGAKGPSLNRSDVFSLAYYLSSIQIESTFKKGSYSPAELEIGSLLEENLTYFDASQREGIRYLAFKLRADLGVEAILLRAREELEKLERLRAAAAEHDERLGSWEATLGQWGIKVAQQEARLKDQLQKLNFVGLSRAFQTLASEKKTEKRVHAGLVLCLAVLIAAVPVGTLAFYFQTSFDKAMLSAPSFIGALIALELILFFFTRVALHNYGSAKAQHLQLRLRHELCAFVEGYADFIEPIRTKGGAETLAKFESIVFSGITPIPDRVPSHFDGLEQLLSAVKSLRGTQSP
jgi:hypothetical protein